jgi:hypothetical protein
MNEKEISTLSHLTDELERITSRVATIRAERGVPDGVPVVTSDPDDELLASHADFVANQAATKQFFSTLAVLD